MLMAAVVITCPGREETCRQTIAALAATDWPGEWPILTVWDHATEGTRQHRQQMNARNALRAGIGLAPDYILFLEDDVAFNAHLCHNLRRWRPLRDGWIGMASLYNPTIGEAERCAHEYWFRAHAGAVYGSQAYILSLDTARFVAEHWHEVEGMQDIKISRLTDRGGWPIYYHTPSLVQHVGKESTWGGGFHWAPDFDATFQSNGHAEHMPFNGDRHIGEQLRRLIDTYDVRSAIETGTWSAHTTRELRTMVPGRVTTIDTTDEHLVGEFGPDAIADLGRQDIAMVLGDSTVKLREVLAQHDAGDHPVLLYLDAQGVTCPLLDELDALADDGLCRDRCVIAIHDVQVPDREWGYNWIDWNGTPEPLSYAVIAHKLPDIYPSGHEYHYNDTAEGCLRGIVYIYPRR